MVRKYGNKGRCPGEYMYGPKFTIDRNGRILYLLEIDAILKFSLDGTYLGSISLDEYPGHFTELRFRDSRLIVFEYIALGEAVYDWIVIDTAGALIRDKHNYVPSFKSTFGPGGGVYEFGKSIYCWNAYSDTVFSIAQDLSPVGLSESGGLIAIVDPLKSCEAIITDQHLLNLYSFESRLLDKVVTSDNPLLFFYGIKSLN